MPRRAFHALVIALLLAGISVCTFRIRPARANATIYVRADGSIDPASAPISTLDSATYVLTGNVSDSIVVERNSIVIDGAGHTVQGIGNGSGIILTERKNVTIQNFEIKGFEQGIWALESSYIKIFRNTIRANSWHGIRVESSENNTIEQNAVVGSDGIGIFLASSLNNTISGNTLSNYDGLFLFQSSKFNSIIGNNITDNANAGIRIDGSSTTNWIFHNNFINNAVHADISALFGVETWDNGYPSGGNYWSDYPGSDENHDGIGDIPYVVQGSYLSNQDNYPLMAPYKVLLPSTAVSISILSPENKTYLKRNVALTFNINGSATWLAYSLDGQGNVTISGNTTLTGLAEGTHMVTIYANSTAGNVSRSETTHFAVDTIPPSIQILSPENKTYTTNSIILNFSVNELPSWSAYCLDGQANQTIPASNKTIVGLLNGPHRLVVYANDTAGNMGASETRHFSIDFQQAQPFPVWIIVALALASAVGIGLVIYSLKTRKSD